MMRTQRPSPIVTIPLLWRHLQKNSLLFRLQHQKREELEDLRNMELRTAESRFLQTQSTHTSASRKQWTAQGRRTQQYRRHKHLVIEMRCPNRIQSLPDTACKSQELQELRATFPHPLLHRHHRPVHTRKRVNCSPAVVRVPP